jgi:hypothetical protein
MYKFSICNMPLPLVQRNQSKLNGEEEALVVQIKSFIHSCVKRGKPKRWLCTEQSEKIIKHVSHYPNANSMPMIPNRKPLPVQLCTYTLPSGRSCVAVTDAS